MDRLARALAQQHSNESTPTTALVTMAALSQDSAGGGNAHFLKLLELQPLQNLAKNFDIDVASW